MALFHRYRNHCTEPLSTAPNLLPLSHHLAQMYSDMTKQSTRITVKHKQDVLKLLGPRPDGSFGKPKLNVETGNVWSAGTIARKYGVCRSAVFGAKKCAKDVISLAIVSTASKKIVRLKAGLFQELEASLAVYMRSCTAHMNGSSLFRADIISLSAQRVVSELMRRWEIEASTTTDEE